MLLRVRGHLQVYLNSPQTQILVVAPVPIGEGIAQSRFAPFFDAEDALRQSRELAHWYRLVAEQFDCAFFDAAEAAQPGEVDCLHLSAQGHKALADALAAKVRDMVE